jgi:nicotinamide-nucleotide amidase
MAMSERSLVLATGYILTRVGARMMVAESCTGGMLSGWLTAAGGSSAWFDGAVISYSNAVKQEVLGVSSRTLEQHGAVSCETAAEMVSGLRRIHQRALMTGDPGQVPQLVGVSITGVAGPQGGSPEKPVGTVCFAFSGPWGVKTAREHFGGDRDAVRVGASEYALTVAFGLVSSLPPTS